MTQKEKLDLIRDADSAYYLYSKPIMTDKEYDKLRKEYINEYGSEDLDYVPDCSSSSFEKYIHPVPLLSLGKIHEDDEDADKKLKRFYDKCSNIILQPKIDGLTIAAVPDKSGKCSFVTRGRKGIEGEKLHRFIPRCSCPGKNNTGETIRGEAFITESNFKNICAMQAMSCHEIFRNSRNAASGILRNADNNRFLGAIDYLVYEIPGSSLPASEQLKLISDKSLFTVVPSFYSNDKKYGWSSFNELHSSIKKLYNDWVNGELKIQIKRGNDSMNNVFVNSDEIPIDGIVLKYDEENSLLRHGSTGHHPNNAIAYKMTADEFETKINDVTWQVGRNSVTPVAELEPIEIDGTTVSRATLHNLGFFNQLSPHKGDIVVICKSGEIIPKVLRISQRNNGEKIKPIVFCPSCNSILKTESKMVNGKTIQSLRCINDSCSERIAQNIAFLGSKDVLNISGLSIQTARKIVAQVPDADEYVIFNLSEEDIKELPGFGDRSAKKLYNEIQAAITKEISIETLFKACCFEGIGETVGKALVGRYKDFNTIMSVLPFPDKLNVISGIGAVTADVISSSKFINRLRDLHDILNVTEKIEGESVEEEKKAASGTNWVITGKFIVDGKHIVRDELVKMIESVGGTVQDNINHHIDYLLVANMDTVSTKAQKAKKNGVRLVTYDFLIGLMMA